MGSCDQSSIDYPDEFAKSSIQEQKTKTGVPSRSGKKITSKISLE
jgi:hypothetical protein